MHLKDECSHVISEIKPQGSNQPKDTYGKSKGENSDRRKLPLKVANMYFNLLSCTEGLFPFPYADYSSLLDESRAKNTHFSTYTRPICYTK
jgi:hypothetical protein